jgi:imidazolonepropionase-like amidohydrolase
MRERTGIHSCRLTAALIAVVLPVAFGCAAPAGSTSAPADSASSATVTPAVRGHAATEAVVLRGGRLMTAAGDVLEIGDVLVRGDRILEVGTDLAIPVDARVIDVRGKTVTPGIIDTHSHMGVYPSPHLKAHADGNEIVGAVTAYARAADGFWPQDPQIDRARAGGVTTAQILPGSANLIGGRSIVVKLYPNLRSVEDARFVGVPAGLKMACGENPKRIYSEKGGPYTRMGNFAGYRKAFQEALEYQRSWDRYEKAHEKWQTQTAGRDPDEADPAPEPPGRDFGLETLAGVLNGEILVHVHCYRADEMSLMMELAESFGFKIRSFHHAVEAYKIADRLAAAGTAASMWADRWGFKAEAYDGIRENAAIVSAAGGRAIIHSDSAVGIQHLNQEAAKAMYAGRRAGIEISDDEALRWITRNSAWALGIDTETGSIEPGKLADLVVWDRNPFSVYARAEQVFIDGALVYSRGDQAHDPRTDFDIGLQPGDIGSVDGGAP